MVESSLIDEGMAYGEAVAFPTDEGFVRDTLDVDEREEIDDEDDCCCCAG